MEKKILVINPDYSSWPEWPVGMAYVLACLDNHGIPFDFVDCTTTKNYLQIIKRKLLAEPYLAVASGGLIGYYRVFKDIVCMVDQYAEGTPFILGGNIVKDGNDKLLFETIGMDYGILGEAETALAPFLHALARGEKNFVGYTGVFFRNGKGEYVRNKQKRMDLSEENILPAWHYFDSNYYIAHSNFAFLGGGLRYVPVLSGRGCIGKCGFCSPSTGGFKKRPIEHVLEEIDILTERYEFDTLCFLNEMFYPTAKEVREFCHAYMERGIPKKWFVQVRVDANLDVETLRLMREAGCIAVTAGIESGSNAILKRMNKKTTTDQIKQHFRNCRTANMSANGTVIIGYDGETEADIKQTFDLLIEEDISSGEALLFAYQGTAVYEKACRKGLITDEDKHLDAISGNLFRPTVMDDFCNMTAMSDFKFFSVASREVRRYNDFLMRNYAVQNLHTDIRGNWRWTKGKMTGNCAKCGNPVEYEFTMIGGEFLGSLGPGVSRRNACKECCNQVVFDPYEAVNFQDMGKHRKNLQEKLSGGQSLVIVGVNTNLDFLLRSDCYGLDYEAIKGVFSMKPIGFERYITFPVLDEDALCTTEADILICTDDLVDTTALTRMYEDHGKKSPEIVYLTSDAFRSEVNRQKCLIHTANKLTLKMFGLSSRELLKKMMFQK